MSTAAYRDLILALTIGSACLAAQSPAGWRTLNSVSKPPPTMSGPVVRDGKCTLAVPANWIDERTVDRSEAHSPDGRSRAFIQEFAASAKYPFLNRKNQTLSNYRNQKANDARVYGKDSIDLKVLEDSPTSLKVMRTTAGGDGNPALSDWTLLAAGEPICYAMVTISISGLTSSAADRATSQHLSAVAEQIISSFGPAK